MKCKVPLSSWLPVALYIAYVNCGDSFMLNLFKAFLYAVVSEFNSSAFDHKHFLYCWRIFYL